jgi:uncharacterized DUF497 family protein
MFQWDSANIAHIAEHGVTSDEAEQVVNNEPIELEFQSRNDEARIVMLGETDKRRVLVAVTTWRDELIRVVTAFPANRKMRAFYTAQKAKGEEHGRLEDS